MSVLLLLTGQAFAKVPFDEATLGVAELEEAELQQPHGLLDGTFPVSHGQADTPSDDFGWKPSDHYGISMEVIPQRPGKKGPGRKNGPGKKGPGRKNGPKRGGGGPRDGKAQMGMSTESEMGMSTLVEGMQEPTFAVDHALEPGFKDYVSNGVSIYGGSRDERMRRMRYFVWNWDNGRPLDWGSDEVYYVEGDSAPRKTYGAEIVNMYSGSPIPHCFNPNLPTKLFIHGWRQGMPAVAQEVINGHIARGDQHLYNFLGMDWRDAAEWQQGWTPGNGFNIPADNTLYVGQRVADNLMRFMEFMFQEDKSYWDKIHIVAHSLGAHVSGVAARKVKADIGVHMPFLTSCDTAGPKFVDDDSSHFALRITDFKYHEAIHTNGAINRPFLLRARLGNGRCDTAHADWYFNGGEHQPGCTASMGGCSHGRSYAYYGEAIGNPNSFRAKRCTLSPGPNGWGSLAERGCLDKQGLDDIFRPWLHDGYVPEQWADFRPVGNFLVMTNDASPFSRDGWN